MKRFFGERYDFLPKIGKAMRNLDHIPIRVDDILMHLIQYSLLSSHLQQSHGSKEALHARSRRYLREYRIPPRQTRTTQNS